MAVTGAVNGAEEHEDDLEKSELEAVSPDRSGEVTIDDALQDADGRTEMVVRFGSADLPSSLSETGAVETLQRQADDAQADALRWAETTDGVEVKNTFWIFNGILLDVNADEVSAEEVARGTGAESVHANFELTTMDEERDEASAASSAAASAVEANASETTYGLDMINATEVWEQYGTQGEGAAVAVLDTGIDADHPDLDLYTEDPEDPTYPGGFAEFDDSGDVVEGAEPADESGHGTHTSGTVSGADDPEGVDEAFGVAPEADLLHGKVIPGGSGSFAQIAGGMEWAVEDTHADVVTMSLGADGYHSELVEPSENARDAGVVLVASAGNDYHGSTGAPGNVYPNFASGAVNADHEVADFSGGETVDTQSAYPDASDYWPDEYVVPNAAAPGVDVLSSVPGGGYDDTYSGTSMSAPHKAGAFALMVSAAGGDVDRELLYDAMEETAWKPDDWDEPGDEYDERYGMGIIDVAAATDLVALESGVNGTVTDSDGEPIEGATVATDDGFEATTDADGEYTLLAEPGTYELEVSAFGFESASATVAVPGDETFVEEDFELEDGVGAALAAGQPDGLEGGDAFDVTFDVANLESYAVERAGDYAGDLELTFEGEPVDEGEEIAVDDLTGEVTLTVAIEADTTGELGLEHAFAGAGDSETLTTGPTAVFEEFVPVAVVDDGSYGDTVVERLEDRLPANYDLSLLSGEEAVDAAGAGEYESYVVQDIDETHVEELATSTDDPGTGVVWLDAWGSSSNAIPAKSNVLGNPESTAESYTSPNPDVELLAEHPIFDGVGDAGDSVPIHDATFADHAWFDGYDGDVIGHIQAGGVTDGGGIGVEEEKRTALLATFGSSSFVGPSDFTTEADAILANAVEWSAEQPPVDLVEEQPARVGSGEMLGAEFAVNDLEKIQVSLAEESTADRDELDLYVGGTVNAWDEWRAYDPPMTADDYAVEVDPVDETVGSVALETTFVFADEEVTVTTGPTAVYDAPLTVPEDVESVQEAVDLAPDGAEIVLEDGTYEETVAVTDADDLTVTGENATIVAPEDAESDATIRIGADGTTVSGVTADGFAVEDAADVSLTGVEAVNATTGVAVTDSADVDVTASDVTDVDHGIAVDGSEGVTVTDNTVTDAATGVSVSDGAVESIAGNDVAETETGIAVADGATASVSDNKITDSAYGLSVAGEATEVEAAMNTIEADIGVLGSDIATDAVSVDYNDLEGSGVAIAQDGDAALDGRLNWFGDRGPAAADLEGDVVSQPFLTAAPDAVDREEPTALAVDLSFDAGETYTVGVPGTTDQTVGDAFGDLNGSVYGYDAGDDAWNTLTTTDDLSSLSAMMVVPEEDGRAVLEFQSEDDAVVPGSEALTQGWNLVSPTAYTEYDDGFGSSNTPDSLLTAYEHADGHLGEDVDHLGDGYAVDGNANPFGGYWIHVESADDTYEYGVDLHTNPTVEEIYEALGLMTETDSAASIDATAPSAQASG